MTAISSVDPLLAALRAAHSQPDDADEERAEERAHFDTKDRSWLYVASPLPPPIAPINRIMVAVARDYGVSVRKMQSSIRTVDIVLPRQVVMYLAKRHAYASLPAIGRVLGGRDHTTVLHGVKRIEALMATDAELAQRINKLIAVIFPDGAPHDTYR